MEKGHPKIVRSPPFAMQNLALTGITGILIGAIAFSSKPSTSQSPAPTPTPTASPIQAEKSRRLTISVSVSTMSDLKVTEGQTLQTGDIIADLTPQSTHRGRPTAARLVSAVLLNSSSAE
jgi:hypothetical protein